MKENKQKIIKKEEMNGGRQKKERGMKTKGRRI